MKREVETGNTKSAHLMSQAVVSNGFIFVSGQVHADENLVLVGETVEEKLAAIMGNIESILRSTNAGLDDIVKVVIYVTDMSIGPELNEAYPKYFTKPYPVRELVCVSALPLGANIELSVIAAA